MRVVTFFCTVRVTVLYAQVVQELRRLRGGTVAIEGGGVLALVETRSLEKEHFILGLEVLQSRRVFLW